MTKRPLSTRFRQKALDLIKITTIRNNPWPVGKPIMLYSWSGKAYASPHADLCPVTVIKTCPILITRDAFGAMEYRHILDLPRSLWSCEGFDSQQEMDEWFRPMLKKPGAILAKHLMLFSLLEI
jgi:hypothetical protein